MDSKKELALSLVTCSGWSWLPGMLLITPEEKYERVLRVRKSDGYLCLADDSENTINWYDPKGSYPDLYDPATLGCVMSLLKFRMKEPTLHLTPDKDGWYVNKLSLDGPEWYCGNSTWGLEGCYSPMLFSSQQEAVAYTLVGLDDYGKVH